MSEGHYIIACGGTGGHLSPGIALAEGLVDRGHRVTLLISNKKVDTRLVEKYPHFRFLRVPGAPFSLHPVKFLRFLVQQSKGMLFSLRLLKRDRAQAIVGFGGFTTTTIILAGAWKGIPILLHEANRVPGRAIRTLSRFAKRVYLPPGVTLSEAGADVVRPMSLPVRKEIHAEDVGQARLRLRLDPGFRVVSILGGSQGATALNEWARTHAETFAKEGVQLYCVTGMGKGETTEQVCASDRGGQVKAIFSPFCDQMGTLMSASDLAITRAGAGTIAELIRCGTPSVLVPFPFAADNHQAANADYHVARGGGVKLDQSDLSQLTEEVRQLLSGKDRLRSIRENLAALDREHSLDEMLDDVETIAGTRGKGVVAAR